VRHKRAASRSKSRVLGLALVVSSVLQTQARGQVGATVLGYWEGAIGDRPVNVQVLAEEPGRVRVFLLPKGSGGSSKLRISTAVVPVVTDAARSLRWTAAGSSFEIAVGPSDLLRGRLWNGQRSVPFQLRRREAPPTSHGWYLLRSPTLIVGVNVALFAAVLLQLVGRRRLRRRGEREPATEGMDHPSSLGDGLGGST